MFDPNGVELVEDAMTILAKGTADCDSVCILFASMCESIGLPCRFVTIRSELTRPDIYTHVYCEVKIRGHGWMGADCTMKNKPFGWRPDKKYPATAWNASKDAPEIGQTDDVSGLGNPEDLVDITDYSQFAPPPDPTMVMVGTNVYGQPMWMNIDELEAQKEADREAVVQAGENLRIAQEEQRQNDEFERSLVLEEQKARAPLPKRALSVRQSSDGRPTRRSTKAKMGELMLSGFSYPGVQETPEDYTGLHSQWQIENSIQQSDDIDGIVADSFAARNTGMGFLGEAEPSYYEIAAEIFSGEMAQKLSARRRENSILTGELEQKRQKIATIGDANSRMRAMELWQRAKASHQQTVEATHSAIAKYNAVVEFIISQPVVFAGAKPNHLGNLGAGFALVPTLLAAGVFAGFATAFLYMWKSAGATKGFLEQLNDLLRSGVAGVKQGGSSYVEVLESTGKVAVVGAIAVGLFLFLRKRGTI